MELHSRRLLEIARTGDLSERAELADSEDLPHDVYWLLADDAATEVVCLVARNSSAPRELLERLADRDEHLKSLVMLNASAPHALKELAPTAQHTQISLERYLEELGATRDQRNALMENWMSRDVRPLGEVWGEIARSTTDPRQ